MFEQTSLRIFAFPPGEEKFFCHMEYHVGHSYDTLLSLFANNCLWCEETHTGAKLTKRRTCHGQFCESPCLSCGLPGIWLDVILVVSGRVFLGEMNICICRLSQADGLCDVGGPIPSVTGLNRPEKLTLPSTGPRFFVSFCYFFHL